MTASVAGSVRPSIRAALSGLIDYAGLFPPAALPLATAWPNYLAYRRSAERWMLAHFVVGAAKLDELLQLARDLPADDDPPTLSVLGRPAATQKQWFDQWSEDLQTIGRFARETRGRIAIAAIEARLPDEIVAAADLPSPLAGEGPGVRGSAATSNFAVAALSAMSEAGLASAALFLELPLGGLSPFSESSEKKGTVPFLAFSASLDAHVAGLAAAAQHDAAHLGLKLRTGGLEPAAFPSPEQIAAVIDACRRHRLPWKATAGLHHPIRQHRPEVNCPMHGFINVVAATVFAAAHQWPPSRLAEILADQSPDHFEFTPTGLTWQRGQVTGGRGQGTGEGATATIDQITRARTLGMISLGSCSFDEPREDLRALGWP